MKKIIYNKLVRDNIINIIKNSNKECNYRILNNEEYIMELNKKLIEETKEYQEEFDIKELADIQEVINAIVIAKGYSFEEFNEIREAKETKNGAFNNKLFLIDVTEKN